jgi:hypothetical protein
MAQTLPAGSPSEAGRHPAVERLLNSRASIPSAVAVLAAVLVMFAYEVHGYLNAECHAAMHAAGLDRETAELFDDVGGAIVGLRKGTADAPRWNNPEFQDQMKDAQAVLAGGRRALKEHDGFAALGSIIDLEKSLAQAKTLATNRVNFILAHQDASDYDAYEKYRLEGRDLVGVVKALDSALEVLSGRTKQLPKACSW